MSESASASAEPELRNESLALPSVLDAAPGLNPVVAAALRHYAAIKESFVTLMKKHAKSLSHDAWGEVNKNIDVFGDALTLVSMEVSHLEGKLDLLKEQRVLELPGTYAAAVAGAGAATCPPETPAARGPEILTVPEPAPEPRETLLIYGKPDVNTWVALTTKFNPLELNIQNVSVRNIASNGVSVQAANKEGLERLKAAIETDESIKEILTPKFPVRFRPQFRVTGVDPSVTRESALQKLKEQNGLEFTEEQITIKTVFLDRFSGTQTITFEADGALFKIIKEKKYIYLGWTRCPVVEYFHVIRCSKCCQYGHTRRFCQADEPVCGRCSTQHEQRCTNEKKCSACSKSNERNGTTIPTDHSFYDVTCPLYKQQVERRRARTTY